MAVTVVFGTAGSGKTEYCFSQIKQWADQGGNVLLLVPDQATYGMERRFAETMPGKGFAGIQIVGFSRLAFHVFQERGTDHPSLSALAKQIILQRLLRTNDEQLTVLRTAARQPHFVDTVGRFISECRSFCIDASDLQKAVSDLGDQVLSRKLKDISVLYQGYCDFLQEHLGEADDVMTLLTREISNYSFLKGAHVYVDGFHWFTPQQMNVLQAIGETAADMTVTLTMDQEKLQQQRRETAIFHRPYEVYCQLCRVFPQIATRSVSGVHVQHFAKGFFQTVPQRQKQPVAGLTVIECSNREVEVDSVARRIVRLCHAGYRYRDILVLTRTSELYNHITERVFREYHIPCFSDYRRPMTEHPAAEAISAALDVIRSRWDYEPLFRLLKTDLFPLDRRDVDDLENYCLAYGIQGHHWLKQEDWTYYYDRHAVNDDMGTDKEQYLTHINEIRRVVSGFIFPLFDAARTTHSLRDWCTLLYHWLDDVGVAKTLRQWKAEDDAAGRMTEGKEHEQVWKQIVSLFNELVTLCGDDVIDIEEFSQMVEDGLADVKFSLIPPTLDHVTITAIERGYTMQAKIVFLCGVNDGIFPKHSGDESLLNDDERERLGKLGLVLGPGSRFRSLQERFLFYVAATRATESLYISYALADEDGAALEASSWIHQIIDNGYVSKAETENGDIPAHRESDYILSMPAALRYLPVMLRSVMEGNTAADIWMALYDWAYAHGWHEQAVRSVQGLFHWNVPQKLSDDMVRLLYTPNGRLCGSVTKFEAYRRCPFAYFSQYGLQLEERAEYHFSAPDLGILVHGALRLMGEELLTQGRKWCDIPDEDIDDVCRCAIERLSPEIQHDILMSDAYFEQIRERLIRTLIRTVRRLCLFSGSSNFQMAALEKSFGYGDSSWQPLRFSLENGIQVVVTGQVDRIDVRHMEDRDFVVVIDYKSGTKKLDLTQIYFGLELQLLTYMYVALLNMGGKAVPAAILYCHVRDDKTSSPYPVDESTKEKQYNSNNKLNGFYLQDGGVMQELDTSMQGYSQFLNLRLNKDGMLSTQSANVYGEEDWQSLLTMTSNRLRAIAGNIVSGDISIHPVLLAQKSPCGYCCYRAFCSFDTQLRENRYAVKRKLPPEKIIEHIHQEEGGEYGMD